MKTTTMTKQKIFNVLQQSQSHLKALGVKKIGLFGSYVREGQRTGSDIDLLVEFEPNQKTFDTFMKLSFFLEDVFQQRVEIVTLESLSPYIGPHILKEVEYASLPA